MDIKPVIKRSKRRTLSIVINRRGELIVHAPIKYPDSKIFAFMNEKMHWIQAKLAEINANKKEINLIDNETFSILGEDYIIKTTDKARVKLDDPYLLLPRQDSKDKLIAYLKRFAKSYLTMRVAELASEYDFQYKSIKITSAVSRWGSCSGSNALNFTYKLMLCPKGVVDYIIIHELTHTIIKNHSKRFYSHIAKIMPDYKLAEKWLRQNKSIIELI